MGWTVLYIAFGIVALWLLGEVLLQYKARLRWRLLAFTGFMGVVLGVLIPNIFVIVLGTIAFAVGQTYVTLSFRSGFSTGWAIGGRPTVSKRRKAAKEEAADREPALEVSDLEYEPAAAQEPLPVRPAADAASVYTTEPMPDETGQYGVYDDALQDPRSASRADADAATGTADAGGYGGGYDPYSGYGTQQAGQDAYAAHDPYATHDGYANQDAYAGQGGYGAQNTYAADQDAYNQQTQQYGYGTGEQQYAAYSDPSYGGGGAVNGGQQYDTYDSFGGRQQYAAAPGEHDQHQQQYANDTPPGGVWVPQQRERQDDPFPPAPGEKPQQGYDAGSGSGSGYQNDQYRY
ncbi:hypothetical protein AB0P17_01775 [Streptomyces sp. NPDC088124]|uniref:hypothetical protein n=1 Tax=Streptomyces sp. NPDC088124 TaxID=3154654 RepID=UPI00341CA6B1